MAGRRGDTVNSVFGRLRQGILAGDYAPGQRMIEADLTRDHGVSRGPVREAFRQLAAEGLIQIVPNRGAIVRKLSRKEISDLFQIRGSLEGLAAFLAAQNIDKADNRRRIRSVVGEIAELRKMQTSQGFSRENSLLHEVITDLAANPQLETLLRQMQLPLARFQLRSAIDQYHRDQSMLEHDKIIKTLLSGDAVRSEKAMKQHLQNASDRILRFEELASER